MQKGEAHQSFALPLSSLPVEGATAPPPLTQQRSARLNAARQSSFLTCGSSNSHRSAIATAIVSNSIMMYLDFSIRCLS